MAFLQIMLFVACLLWRVVTERYSGQHDTHILSVSGELSESGIGANATEDCQCVDRAKKSVAFVAHGLKQNKFWQDVSGAALRASQELGLKLDVILFDTFSDEAMAKEIASLSGDYDFLIVTIPSPKVGSTVKMTVKKPFYVINAGEDDAKGLGALGYIGNSDRTGGEETATSIIAKLPDGKMDQAICLDHQQGNAGHQARCDGFFSQLPEGVTGEQVFVPGGDPDGVLKVLRDLRGKISMKTGVGMLVSGSIIVPQVLEAFEQDLGRTVFAITFDADPTIYAAVESGKFVAAVDQQSWLQGYLPVYLGAQAVFNHLKLPMEKLLTGPRMRDSGELPLREHLRCIHEKECKQDVKIGGVTHGINKDGFWSQKIRAGVEQAARDTNADVDYSLTDKFEGTDRRMSQEIAKFAAQKMPVFTTIPSPEVADAVRQYVKNIPIVSYNSRHSSAEEDNAIAMNYVGQPDAVAGEMAGKVLAEASSCKKPACVVHNMLNSGFVDRCNGFSKALEAKGLPKMQMITIPGDSKDFAKQLQAEITKEMPDCLLLTAEHQLDPVVAVPRPGARVGCVDLSSRIAKYIETGKLNLAVNQQAYLQGYLPVLLLSIYERTGLRLPTKDMLSGPDIITRDTVGQLNLKCEDDGFPVCGTQAHAEGQAPAEGQKAREPSSGLGLIVGIVVWVLPAMVVLL